MKRKQCDMDSQPGEGDLDDIADESSEKEAAAASSKGTPRKGNLAAPKGKGTVGKDKAQYKGNHKDTSKGKGSNDKGKTQAQHKGHHKDTSEGKCGEGSNEKGKTKRLPGKFQGKVMTKGMLTLRPHLYLYPDLSD